MNTLVRNTTYYQEDLLEMAKRAALDQKRNLYEVFNDALRHYLYSNVKPIAVKNKPFQLEDVFGQPHNLGIKKKILTRKDYYNLSKL